jgi:dTMP kinase
MDRGNKKSFARFVSFEGIDGCGKSTQMLHFGHGLDKAGIAYIPTREPGATVLGASLRKMLLDPSFSGMDHWAELLLYLADRAQHVAEVIRPALEQGLWVLSDRYADATLAYQGAARGLDMERLKTLHEWTTGNLWPDATVLLDCDVDTAHERRSGRSGAPDRLELQKRDFHERVRKGYLDLAASEPERFFVLDASRSVQETAEELRELFRQRLGMELPA